VTHFERKKESVTVTGDLEHANDMEKQVLSPAKQYLAEKRFE
jgi:hypothetical protein